MNSFINKAHKKASTMSEEGLRSLVESLFNEYSLLDAMVDSITDGIILLDAKNRVIKVNKSMFLILGLPIFNKKSMLRLNNIKNIFQDDAIRAFVEATILNQKKCEKKEFLVLQNAESKYIELSILPLVKNKKIIGSIIIVSNITERKIAELNAQRLEHLSRLTTLLASISHEVKNPLAAISIHVQLLEKMLIGNKDFFNEKSKKHFNVIKEEIERLNKIVVDFLFTVRPIKFEIASVNINALFNSLIDTFSEEFNSYNIKIILELQESMPLLQGDERFLRQAIMNIMINAKEAMAKKGGQLRIRGHVKDESLILEISDSGDGIPKSLLNKIFEPYFSTKDGGSGLGLTLTYKVITEHGGSITLHSKKDVGTTFKIMLPIVRGNAQLLLSCNK